MAYYEGMYTPNSFELADLLAFIESLPKTPPNNGKFYWILKNSDYIKCLKYNVFGGYDLIKQGSPDTMLNIPIIVDDSVGESCVFNFTSRDHAEIHKYLLGCLNELVGDYQKQNGDIGRNGLILDFIDWATLQCFTPSGEPTEHKPYPHVME